MAVPSGADNSRVGLLAFVSVCVCVRVTHAMLLQGTGIRLHFELSRNISERCGDGDDGQVCNHSRFTPGLFLCVFRN